MIYESSMTALGAHQIYAKANKRRRAKSISDIRQSESASCQIGKGMA
jgi:hypothetical protein